MQARQTTPHSYTANRKGPHASGSLPRAIPPMDRLMDLLQEVRQLRRQLQRHARESASAANPPSYADALHAVLENRIQQGDARTCIVCYACAAELGVSMELEAELCRQVMSGSLGFPLRVLFWATHRRMQSSRRGHGNAWLLPHN